MKSRIKSQFPYLVDLSLTNQCPLINNCSVGDKCYASPVHKTEVRTDFWYFKELVTSMFKSNVLEVAIGGYSEPTTAQLWSTWIIDDELKSGAMPKIRPYNLADVCEHLKAYNFKVGITTRNYNIHKLPFIEKLCKNIDSIAFSVSSVKDVLEADQAIDKMVELGEDVFDWEKWQNITMQPILETIPYPDFLDMLTLIESLGYKMTLLGYKDFGFGQGKRPHKYESNWITDVREIFETGFGVDSQIVADWPLQDFGVEEYRLVGREGESTCFVDVQKKQMKPSSFTDEYYDLTKPDDFLQQFHKF